MCMIKKIREMQLTIDEDRQALFGLMLLSNGKETHWERHRNKEHGDMVKIIIKNIRKMQEEIEYLKSQNNSNAGA